MRAVAIASATLAIGCAETLPPPLPPAPGLPAAFPAADGDESEGRVVIGTDIPARVERVTARGDVKVCERTPCSVLLLYGEHRLRFTALADGERTSVATIAVRAPREIVNHVLGLEHTSIGTTLGTFTTIVGFGLMLIPVLIATSAPRPSFTPATFVAGGMLGVGAGVAMMANDPSVSRDGATTQWTPAVQLGVTF
jgi:hypothetical protein